MLWEKFQSRFEELRFKVKFQNISIIVLTIALTSMSFLFYSAMRAKRTIIVPSTLMAQLEISDIDASPQFIKTNVGYALSLLYSYTPASAASRFEEFLISFVQLERAKELRILLLDRLRQIQQVKVSESIEIEDLVFEKRGALLVRSKIYRYTLGYPIATEPLYLRILYQIRDGNFKISSLVNLTTADYSRLLRSQQIDGKKIEEQDRKRERGERNKEKADEREEQKQERLHGVQHGNDSEAGSAPGGSDSLRLAPPASEADESDKR